MCTITYRCIITFCIQLKNDNSDAECIEISLSKLDRKWKLYQSLQIPLLNFPLGEKFTTAHFARERLYVVHCAIFTAGTRSCICRVAASKRPRRLPNSLECTAMYSTSVWATIQITSITWIHSSESTLVSRISVQVGILTNFT